MFSFSLKRAFDNGLRFLKKDGLKLHEIYNKFSVLTSVLNTKMSNNGDLSRLYKFNDVYEAIGGCENIWIELTTIASENNAINLGQGFPNYMSNPYLVKVIEETIKDPQQMVHQYTRSSGHLRLVNALSKFYSKLINRNIDPLNEVLITIGADGSLFNAFMGFLNPDDEVIIFEPYFNSYEEMTVIARGKCVFVPLKPKSSISNGKSATSTSEWTFDVNELEAAFTPRTKILVFNTPNNPLGKVYTQEELEIIARLCIKNNVICISDEVYEHITFDCKHIRIASFPGMWERTITIGSAGKAFSSTGIKMGWSYGCKELMKLCQIVHSNSIYCCPTFFQEVLARCFELELQRMDSPECYFNSISVELKPKRDHLAALLLEAGLTPVIPEGAYFMLANISNIAKSFKTDEKECKDSKFVKYLAKEKGLATIPASIFYSKEHKYLAENYIRFCFFKDDETINKAAEILKKLKTD